MKLRIASWLVPLALGALAAGAAAQTTADTAPVPAAAPSSLLHYGPDDFYRVEKIDAHMHLHSALPVFFARAKADNVRVLTINVDYPDFPPLAQQQQAAIALQRAHPADVAFAATFATADIEQPGWAGDTIAALDQALSAGAVGVKVWKNIGMALRDKQGRAIMIDDARFDPVFDHLAARGVVLLGHQAEPRNCWLPFDQMTVAGDRQYFSEHPQYHMYGKTDWPSHEEQLAARDRMLDRHPQLRYVGVHLASLEWDVDEVARFLDHYPNASVDVAARIVHLEQQATAQREKVRSFLIRYQDRIMYGTDLASSDEQSDQELATEAHQTWLADWQFFNSDDVMHSSDLEQPFRGLALPKEVVDKLYWKNARRMYPQAWHG